MTIKRDAASGVKWTSVSQAGRQAMQWVTFIVLARILSPSDFGLVGMAMVVIGFVALFKDLGTSAAVIQRRDQSDEFLSSVYWVNVAFGFVATLVFFLLSPLVGDFYREPQVTSLLRALSITFFISGLSILHQAVLERDLAFNKLAKLELTAFFLGSVVGIGAALKGFGVWSLVFQSLAVTLTTTVLLWIASRWRPRLLFHWSKVKSVGSYSLNLTGFNIINYFIRNADNLLIGYFIGAEALGFYNLAYRLMLYPLSNVSYVINRVIFPVYSQIRDNNAKFRRVFLQAESAIAFVTFPLMIGMVALREPFINIVFGSKWSPVILLIFILAPVGIVQSIMTITGSIYQAKGRTDWMFWWGIGSGSLIILSFVIGLKWGIIGVATAYAIVNAVILYPCFAIPFRLIGLSMRSLVHVLWRPLFSSLIMLAFIYGLETIIPSGISSLLVMAEVTLLGIGVYLLMSWFMNRDQFKLILDVLGSKRGRTE